MSVLLEFGDDAGDCWNTMFERLEGYILQVDAFVASENNTLMHTDVMLNELDEDGNGNYGFWFSLWNNDTEEADIDQFFVRADDLRRLYIY